MVRVRVFAWERCSAACLDDPHRQEREPSQAPDPSHHEEGGKDDDGHGHGGADEAGVGRDEGDGASTEGDRLLKQVQREKHRIVLGVRPHSWSRCAF